jgi:hypothetical protein
MHLECCISMTASRSAAYRRSAPWTPRRSAIDAFPVRTNHAVRRVPFCIQTHNAYPSIRYTARRRRSTPSSQTAGAVASRRTGHGRLARRAITGRDTGAHADRHGIHFTANVLCAISIPSICSIRVSAKFFCIPIPAGLFFNRIPTKPSCLRVPTKLFCNR